MNIRNLIELLPPIFKSNDTYKVGGKGFLERYLEICGNYLTDIITTDIDNILDLISIDSTPKEYLNYLWEFLGEIPFANIYNIDSNKWALYYNGTHDKEDLWLEPNGKPIQLNDRTARDIIKYSLSLYKIRGTKEFFEVILRLYGLEYKTTSSLPPSYNEMKPYLDVDRLDHSNLDVYYECGQCGTIDLDLDDSKHQLVFADKNGVIIMGSDEQILTGRSLYTDPNFDDENGGELEYFDLKQLVTAYNNYQGQIDFSNTKDLPADVKMFVAIRRAFDAFFDRFIPYNAKITIEYDGIPVDDNSQFYVNYADPDNSIISSDNQSVELLLSSSSKWPVYDKRYQVSGNGVDWSGEYHIESTYQVTSPGTYYFRLASSSKIVPVTVGISKIHDHYNLELGTSSVIYLSDLEDHIAIINPRATLGNTQLSTTVTSPDGTTYEVNPGSSFTISGTTGIYKVAITNYPLVYKLLYVYKRPIVGKTSLVDIPYGVTVHIRRYNADGGNEVSTYGEPFDENTDPMSIAIVESTKDGTYPAREVVDIEPWLRDPEDPTKILYGVEFIKNENFVLSLAIMDSDRFDSGWIGYEQAIIYGGVSINRAIEYINELISKSTKAVSIMVTLHQFNIRDYYDPYRVTQDTGLSDGGNLYLHNPVLINIVVPANGDQPSSGGSKFIQSNMVSFSNEISFTAKGYPTDSVRRDVILIGAILINNLNYIWIPLSVNGKVYSGDPYYCYPLQLPPSQPKLVDISELKLKYPSGTTIYRTAVAFDLDNFGVTNVPEIIISDVQSEIGETDGLTMDIDSEYEIKHYPKGLGGLEVKLKDGSILIITKRYIVKLNNTTGLFRAKLKFKLIIGGVFFNGTNVQGGIILDLDGNIYNTDTQYTEYKVRYYDEELGSVEGNHGHIFMVKGFGDDPDYNIMLDIMIDPEAEDGSLLIFSMDPEDFYLPVNGKEAITNLLVTRPYTLHSEMGNHVTYTEDSDQVVKSTPLEYRVSPSESVSKLFTASGAGATSIKKNFNVIKNN